MNKRGWGTVFSVFLSLILTLLVAACEPVPEAPLTKSQKAEDMTWLFSRFETLYAPRDYKADRNGFSYDQLKTKYMHLALNTQSNEAFYMVMHQFVAEFSDAHTRLTFTPSPLPGRASMVFLGISGERAGDGFLVKEILPTIDPQSFPLKKGDIITHVNGKPFLNYLEETIIPYRNLGNQESNYTALAGSAFTRSSLSFPVPEEKEVVLTYKSLTKTQEFEPESKKITMPWIIKDFQTFKNEIVAAKLKQKTSKKKKAEAMWFGVDSTQIALLDQNGNALTLEDIEALMGKQGSFDSSYRYLSVGGWTADKKKVEEKKSGIMRLKAEGALPASALIVEGSEFYPAYVKSQEIVNKNGKPTGQKKLIGYIRIFDFQSPDESILELETTLKKFQELGVKEVIVDTQGNPGGKLTMVMKIAQIFSNKKVKMPQQQFGLNYWWLDNIQMQALNSTGPQQEMYKRLYTKLKEEADQGKRLSSLFSLEDVAPFELKPNYDLKKDFKLIVLVNEMNASCGDIFPQIIQENKMGLIVGKKTMGAGGNVANFIQAPNSHADLSQTLSLIVKADGTYLENNGVTPDIIITERGLKYSKEFTTRMEKSRKTIEAVAEHIVNTSSEKKCVPLLSLLK